MSGQSFESEKDGGRHRSSAFEQSPRQDSSEERLAQRRNKRPDLERYRPPRGRPGGGDGLSPTVRQVTAEKAEDKREQEILHPPPRVDDDSPMNFEKWAADRKKNEPLSTGLKKSKSDVGRDDGFDLFRGGVTIGRHDGGGNLVRGESNRNSRRGRGGGGRHWRPTDAYDQSAGENMYQQQSTGRGNGSRNQERGGRGRKKPESYATNGADAEPRNRFAVKEFSRSKADPASIAAEKEWRKYAQGVICSNYKDPSENGTRPSSSALPPAALSSNVSEPPCAASTPQEQPGSPTLMEPTMKFNHLASIAALDENHGSNLSWGDEMEEEDKRRQLAAAKPSVVVGNGSQAMNVGIADNRPPAQRGGLIPMTAEVANAMNRSEHRGKRGAGRGIRGNPGWDARHFNPHAVGRGIRHPEQGYVFPEPRHFGGRVPNQSLHHRAPAPGDLQFQAISNMGHCRPMPFQPPPPPPAYADHADGNSEAHLPHDLAIEINRLENEVSQLAKVVGSGHFRKGDIKQLLAYRKQLQQLFETAVFVDPCNEEQKNLDHRMWKSAFYQPVEALRSFLQAQSSGHDYCLKELLALIEEGINFYEGLLKNHEMNYGFKLDQHFYSTDDKLTKVLAPPPTDKSRFVKYSLACCQRYLVSMGDLARYREQVRKTQQYGVARSYYNKAAQLAPTNGRAHNQLALLAMYTNRWLDAVFYYVRSLAAKHPFTTAKESLSGLFEDIRKKAEHYEVGRKKELEQLRKERGKESHKSTKRLNQREIWKFPDGRTSNIVTEKQDVDEDALLTKVSAQELHKRCIVYLLRSAGILFTKIGVECFEDMAESGLIQLRALLTLDESPLSSAQLVQLTVIFLYLIHYTGDGETESGVIKAVQNNAILISFSVFGLLVERLSQLLEDDSVLGSFNKSLHMLLPSVRIFSMWLSVEDNYKVYSDLASSVGGLDTQRFSISLWNVLADVCNKLEDFKTEGKLKLVADGSRDTKDRVPAEGLQVVLPEDLYVTSFCSIFSRNLQPCMLSKEIDAELAAEHLRLDSLVQLATFLDGSNCEWLTFCDGKYIATSRAESPGAGKIRAAASDDDADADSDLRNNIDEQDLVGEMSQLELLQRDHEIKQTALERENQCRAEIIVEPHYLVVDTNTFIDHRAVVEKIVMSKQYKLAIPFVVYNELLGLEKNEESWLSKQATGSIKMLQEFTKGSLSSYSKYVEAYTSSGTCLDLEYHNNESASRSSNDDLILNCCRNLVSAKQGESVAKQEIRNLRYEPLTIHRKVVLITDDKNLRLKAKGDDIPVIGIRNFVKLARLAPN